MASVGPPSATEKKKKVSSSLGTAGKSPAKRKRTEHVDKSNTSLRKQANAKLKAAINTSLNSSLVHKQTLRQNNRQLAKTLESTRGDLNIAVQANIELKHENQQLTERVNHLTHVAGLKDDQIADEVETRFKKCLRCVHENLGKVTKNLTDTVEMLCDTMTVIGMFDRKSSVGIRTSSSNSEMRVSESPSSATTHRDVEPLPELQLSPGDLPAGDISTSAVDALLPLSESITDVAEFVSDASEGVIDSYTSLSTIMEQSFLPEAAAGGSLQSRGRNRPGRCLRQIDIDSLMEFRASRSGEFDKDTETQKTAEEDKENLAVEAETSDSKDTTSMKEAENSRKKSDEMPAHRQGGLRSRSKPPSPERNEVPSSQKSKSSPSVTNKPLVTDDFDAEDDDSTILYNLSALKQANRKCNAVDSPADEDDDSTVLYNVNDLKQPLKNIDASAKIQKPAAADGPVAALFTKSPEPPKKPESEIRSPTGLPAVSFYSSSKSAVSPASKQCKPQKKSPGKIRRRTYTKRSSNSDTGLGAPQSKSLKNDKGSVIPSKDDNASEVQEEEEKNDAVANRTYETLPSVEVTSPGERVRPRSIVLPFEPENSNYEEEDMEMTEVLNPSLLPLPSFIAAAPRKPSVLDSVPNGDMSLSELASFIEMGKAKREAVQQLKDGTEQDVLSASSRLPRPLNKVTKPQKQKRSKSRDKSAKVKPSPNKIAADASDDNPIQDGRYYLDIMVHIADSIDERVKQAESDLKSVSGEELSGKLRAAIGQASLLTSRQFVDFRELCEKNINLRTDKKTPVPPTVEDLAGSWAVLQLEVNKIITSLDEFKKMRENGWSLRKEALSSSKDTESNKGAAEDEKTTNFTAFFKKPGTIKFTAKSSAGNAPVKTKPGKSRSKSKSTLPKEPKKSRSKPRPAEAAPPTSPTVV